MVQNSLFLEFEKENSNSQCVVHVKHVIGPEKKCVVKAGLIWAKEGVRDLCDLSGVPLPQLNTWGLAARQHLEDC